MVLFLQTGVVSVVPPSGVVPPAQSGAVLQNGGVPQSGVVPPKVVSVLLPNMVLFPLFP